MQEKVNPINIKMLYTESESILAKYCGERGDNEGFIETLERIIKERNILLQNAIKNQLLKLN